MMRKFTKILKLTFLATFVIYLCACDKGSLSRGPSFNDDEIIALLSATMYKDDQTYQNTKISIVEKGSVNDKNQLPIKVNVERDLLQWPSGIKHLNNTHVYYVSNNDFGKMRISDESGSYVEYK